MKTARVWIIGLSLALLTVACSKASPGGTSGVAGTSGGSGAAGTTGSSCVGGQTACGSECVNTATDPTNCGACGIPCSSGQSCQSGSCQCQSGMLCNGGCVSSDATHCGDCTTTCATGQVCSNNVCSTSCATGQTLCGTACVVTNGTDTLNCGACGKTCVSGQACNAGTCGCATGQTLCGSSCVDTSSSNANCGACGTACGSAQHCAGSACVDNSTTGTAGTSGTAGTNGTAGTSGTAGTNGGGMAGKGGTTGTAGTSGTAGTTGAQSSLVTSSTSGYFVTGGTLTTVTSGTATVTVNDSSTAQNWEGFGGAFNEVGWNYLSMLSASDKAKAVDLLYGSDGAKFNLGRIPMGASDYAVTRYTDDDIASGSTDYNMTSFSLTEDAKYLIPYVKAAQALNASIRFWSSPWTPPAWLKTNSGSVNGTNCTLVGSTPFDGGCMVDNAQNLTAYAQYFVKFVQGYAAQGINIEAVSPQNEPNYAQGYPSCLWATALFTKFVGQYLGPAFTTAGLNTKIMLGTMSNGGTSDDPSIVTSVMGDATAKGYIKLLGYQWGMESDVAGAKSYNLPLWQTEHKCGNYPFTVTGENPAPAAFNSSMAPNDQAYGAESWGLIRDWIKAGVTSYSAWNMVLDTVGKGNDTTRNWPQNALLTVNTSSKTLNITPAYYVFRHLSQFVVPGAKVVATTGGDAVAFKNPDGSIITMMYNSGAASTYIVAVGGKKLQFSMPSNGWATVDYVP
jgi:glucosylceramidase